MRRAAAGLALSVHDADHRPGLPPDRSNRRKLPPLQIVTLLVGDQEFDSPKTLAAFALGLVLFLVTLALNVLALHIVRKYREQYE